MRAFPAAPRRPLLLSPLLLGLFLVCSGVLGASFYRKQDSKRSTTQRVLLTASSSAATHANSPASEGGAPKTIAAAQVSKKKVGKAFDQNGCLALAERASHEKITNEDKLKSLCQLEFPPSDAFQRCDFFSEALGLAVAHSNFEPTAFCSDMVKATECSGLMARLLVSDPVTDLAFGECLRSGGANGEKTPEHCDRFHFLLRDAVKDGEIDALRVCYTAESAVSLAASATEAAKPSDDAAGAESGEGNKEDKDKKEAITKRDKGKPESIGKGVETSPRPNIATKATNPQPLVKIQDAAVTLASDSGSAKVVVERVGKASPAVSAPASDSSVVSAKPVVAAIGVSKVLNNAPSSTAGVATKTPTTTPPAKKPTSADAATTEQQKAPSPSTEQKLPSSGSASTPDVVLRVADDSQGSSAGGASTSSSATAKQTFTISVSIANPPHPVARTAPEKHVEAGTGKSHKGATDGTTDVVVAKTATTKPAPAAASTATAAAPASNASGATSSTAAKKESVGGAVEKVEITISTKSGAGESGGVVVKKAEDAKPAVAKQADGKKTDKATKTDKVDAKEADKKKLALAKAQEKKTQYKGFLSAFVNNIDDSNSNSSAAPTTPAPAAATTPAPAAATKVAVAGTAKGAVAGKAAPAAAAATPARAAKAAPAAASATAAAASKAAVVAAAPPASATVEKKKPAPAVAAKKGDAKKTF